MNTNIPQRFWQTATAFIGILIALAAVYLIKELKLISYVGRDASQVSTISVDGTGDATAIPDVATFSFSVTQTAPAVADAQSAATAKINAALAALKAAGVADKDISTDSYSINPHYEYQNAICPAASAGTVSYCPGSKSTLTGYDVSETIDVKIRDLTKAGSIFTSIGSLGVQNVDGLSFSVDNPDAVEAQARSQAIADAQSKADTLAKQLGVHLVRIVSFDENNGGIIRPVMYAAGMASDASTKAVPPSPAIPTGEQKTTDSVTITYEIQ